MALEVKAGQGTGQFSPGEAGGGSEGSEGSEGSVLGSSCSDPWGEAQEGWPG